MRKVLFLQCLLCLLCIVKATANPMVRIRTNAVELIYKVADDGHLYQCYLGKRSARHGA